MRIHSPSFSGSINQATTAYSDLSGSFTGSFTGTDITTELAKFDHIIVSNGAIIGSNNESVLAVTGSIHLTDGQITINGVDVLDSALVYAIALG
jgi:ABC-type uncharacterized transport system ATPase component